MRCRKSHVVVPWAIVSICALASPALGAGIPRRDMAQNAAPAAANEQAVKPGEPTGPEEPQSRLKLAQSPLHLSDSQRQKIRQAVIGEDTEVTFQLKTTKPLKNFNPTVGAKIPPHLPAHALPTTLTSQVPALSDYKYVKVKGQILIVNPVTKKIVDMFPQTPG